MNSVRTRRFGNVSPVIDKQASAAASGDFRGLRRQFKEDACLEVLFAKLEKINASGNSCFD